VTGDFRKSRLAWVVPVMSEKLEWVSWSSVGD
jgi:hypothetical protein